MSKTVSKPAPTPEAASAGALSGTARGAIHLLLLALVAILAYSNTFHTPFILDDMSSIVENDVIKDLSRFLSGEGRAYNPRRVVGYLTLALNYSAGGLNPFGYHVVNLAVHVLTGWSVYFLVRLTLTTPFFSGTGRAGKLALLPFFAALLFVAHPVQSQAVTYIVQRLASLLTLFYLLSLICYVKGRLALGGEEPQRPATGKLRPALFFLGSIFFALVAAQTKEVAATLPLAVLLYEFSFFKPSRRRSLILLSMLLLFVLVAVAGVATAQKPLGELLSDVNELSRETSTISRGSYLLTQFSVIATYLRLLLLPVNQNLDYDYPVYHSLFAAPVFLCFLHLSALAAAAGWLHYRSSASGFQPEGADQAPSREQYHRLIAFGIFWFFITLSIESSVIPIADVIFEHRLYLPMVGACTALAALGLLLFRKASVRALSAGALLVTVVLALATWQRNRVWESSLTLWGDVLAKSPEKSRANNHYGVALTEVGRAAEAVDYLKKAVQIKPSNAYAFYNLGRVYDELEDLDAAVACYQSAIALEPDLAVAHNNLAVDYLIKGADDLAIERYNVLLQMKPGFAEAHNNLGFALKNKGRVDEAIVHFQAAIKANANYAKAYNNLGEAYLGRGELDPAISQFQEAARLKPDDAAIRENLERALGLKQARQ